MRNVRIGSVLLAAGVMLAAGFVFLSGGASNPVAQAQSADCDEAEGPRCLTIVKQTDPDGEAQTFDFEHENGGLTTPFGLSDGAQATFRIEGTTHTVTELGEDGWTLLDIDCSDSQGVDIMPDVSAGSVEVTMNLEEGDVFASAVCVFTNELDDTPSPTPTPTETATATPTPTGTVEATPTETPVSPPPSPDGDSQISPPNTGGGGLR